MSDYTITVSWCEETSDDGKPLAAWYTVAIYKGEETIPFDDISVDHEDAEDELDHVVEDMTSYIPSGSDYVVEHDCGARTHHTK